MALEIVECVIKVSLKIYATVDEVQANKKRCQRLADRVRCLVSPLNELLRKSGNGVVYKEALIDLVRALEEARQFLSSFTKGKSVLRKVQDVCYAKRVKEHFEDLNDRLNTLVPALTFGLQVECRKSVQNAFSVATRAAEDIKDESEDLQDIQQMVNRLGMPSFQCIRGSELREKRQLSEGPMYTLYTANYRMSSVVIKKPKFGFTKARQEKFFTDAKNMLQFNSENIVRVYGISVDTLNSYLVITEYMQLGSLRKVLRSERKIPESIVFRMAIQSARGLYFIHCSDVVHKNVSTSKYFVNEDLHVKISGFEFSGTESSVFSGQPNNQICCIPPEFSVKNSSYTQKTDIFNFGLVLCEILTHSVSQWEHATDVLSTSCPEKVHIPQKIPPQRLDFKLVADCLQAEPFLRPQMEDVIRVLASCINK
ncbi:unnamed protein product [Clavelina lepadiformis]|uniref:Protein kinase domain-containing protein n=1 Tax=Clavelina lepadiformis TaxID=159417 RepID=A0ABP0FD26_CLALP